MSNEISTDYYKQQVKNSDYVAVKGKNEQRNFLFNNAGAVNADVSAAETALSSAMITESKKESDVSMANLSLGFINQKADAQQVQLTQYNVIYNNAKEASNQLTKYLASTLDQLNISNATISDLSAQISEAGNSLNLAKSSRDSISQKHSGILNGISSQSKSLSTSSKTISTRMAAITTSKNGNSTRMAAIQQQLNATGAAGAVVAQDNLQTALQQELTKLQTESNSLDAEYAQKEIELASNDAASKKLDQDYKAAETTANAEIAQANTKVNQKQSAYDALKVKLGSELENNFQISLEEAQTREKVKVQSDIEISIKAMIECKEKEIEAVKPQLTQAIELAETKQASYSEASSYTQTLTSGFSQKKQQAQAEAQQKQQQQQTGM